MCFLPVLLHAQCGAPISIYPYQEDFEINDGGWTSGGTADDWAWGSPVKPVIANAGSNLKCWIAGGTSVAFYNAGERSYVESPCFDFTNIVTPYITCKIFWETEKVYDGANLQYSTNNGSTWNNAGAFGDATDCRNANWFNTNNIINLSGLASNPEGWAGNIQSTSGSCLGGMGSNGWVQIKHTLPTLAGKSQVIFRFTFGSGTTCNDYDGFAFDDITISEAPPLPSLSYQSVLAGCNKSDGSISLTVNGTSGPYSYNWSPNVSSAANASALPSGTYTIIVTDANGCSSSIEATVPSPPAVTLSLSSAPDTCGLGKGTLSANASEGTSPYSYLWSNGATGSIAAGLLPGSYSMTVTDAAGCTAGLSEAVADTGYFIVTLGPDQIICGNTSLVLQPGIFDKYLWQDGSVNPAFNVVSPGAYFVQVEKADGCTASDTVMVNENCLADVLVPNAFTPNDDGFNDLFEAVGADVTSFSMQVYNRWGNVVYSSDNITGGWNGHLSPEGLYAWKIYFTVGTFKPRVKTGTVFLIR